MIFEDLPSKMENPGQDFVQRSLRIGVGVIGTKFGFRETHLACEKCMKPFLLRSAASIDGASLSSAAQSSFGSASGRDRANGWDYD